jgi:hypothetical protein
MDALTLTVIIVALIVLGMLWRYVLMFAAIVTVLSVFLAWWVFLGWLVLAVLNWAHGLDAWPSGPWPL